MATRTAAPSVPDSYDALFTSRLAIVTGKGGVGKTTVSAALALAGAASGRRALLVEVEGRQGFSRAFQTGAWSYEEREFRPGLWGTAIDPEEAMYEYLELFYGMKRMSRMMSRTSALDFVTAAAPGLRDLLLIGKVYEIEKRRREDGRPAYDLIVLDAPPTGRIIPFLESPEGVTEIVRVGPVRRQAGNIVGMLTDPQRTRAFVVTLLEEMPVQETLEATAALAEADIDVGPVIANQVLAAEFDDGARAALEDLGPTGLVDRVRDTGVELDPDLAEAAYAHALVHCERVGLQERMRTRLTDEGGLPVLDLPLLTGATFGAEDLEILADHVALQLGEPGPRARR